MRLWFAHSTEVPIYRQLVTQISLAVLSGDLRPGDKLPSTRELARRFGLHPNTVSAGYRQLEKEGWTERRRGSGIMIRTDTEALSSPEQMIDYHIAGFFRAARELGFATDVVRDRVLQWLEASPPERFVLIDPDEEVRRILLAELSLATPWKVKESALADCKRREVLQGAIALCRPSQTKAVRAALPKGVELITLPVRSPNTWLTPWVPTPEGHLIAVVSHWPEFLKTARTILIATGLAPEELIFRDAREPHWRRGLAQATAILYDSYTVTQPRLPAVPFLVYPLLADATAGVLREYSDKHALPG